MVGQCVEVRMDVRVTARVRVRVRNRSSFAARATLLGALFAGAAGAMHM